jgi:hypothetical protein
MAASPSSPHPALEMPELLPDSAIRGDVIVSPWPQGCGDTNHRQEFGRDIRGKRCEG